MLHASTVARRAEYIPNVEYGRAQGMSLRMDVSLPESAQKTAAIIIVHGGGWVSGDKRYNVEPLFKPLSDAGFAWFSISYRLAKDVTQFGVAIEDVQQAVQFVKQHADEYNIDPERIALLGESAGGQLAAMAALRASAGYNVKALVLFYSPTDLVSLVKTTEYIPLSIRRSVQGTPWEGIVMAGLAQLSPINNVRSKMPPVLFIHGTADALVPISQSQDMCSRMRSAGAVCEVYPVEGGGHGIRWWQSDPQIARAYKQKMVEWLTAELG